MVQDQYFLFVFLYLIEFGFAGLPCLAVVFGIIGYQQPPDVIDFADVMYASCAAFMDRFCDYLLLYIPEKYRVLVCGHPLLKQVQVVNLITTVFGVII